MNNQYECSVIPNGRPAIIIRRKSSEIPCHIDSVLFRLAGASYYDPSIPLIAYEFLQPNMRDKAEAYLQSYGWTKNETEEEPEPECGAV